MNYADQLYIMNTTLLECSVAENIPSDDLCIRYNKELKTWRIVQTSTRKIVFKKTWVKTKKTK